MVISNEKPKKAPNTAAVKRMKLSPSKDLREAFANFMEKYRMSVEEKLPGATGRMIRYELGKKWKSLSEEEKEKFVTPSGRKSKDEEYFIEYGLKNHDSHSSEVKLNQALDGMSRGNHNMDVDEGKDLEIMKDEKDKKKSKVTSNSVHSLVYKIDIRDILLNTIRDLNQNEQSFKWWKNKIKTYINTLLQNLRKFYYW